MVKFVSVDDGGKAGLWPRRVVFVAVPLVLGHLAVALLLPASTWPRGAHDLYVLALNLLASWALLWAARRTWQCKNPVRAAWVVLAAAQACATAGDITRALGIYVLFSPPVVDASSGAYPLAGIGFLAAALLLTSANCRGAVQWLTTLLEVGTAIVAAALLAWALVVGPALANMQVSDASTPIVAGTVAVIGIVPTLLFIQLAAMHSPLTSTRAVWYLVGSSITYSLAGSVSLGAANPLDYPVHVRIANTLWVMGAVLIAIAGVEQAIRSAHAHLREQDSSRRASLAALALPCGAMVGAFALLIWRFDHPVAIPSTALALGVGAILALVLVRLVLAVAEGTRLYGAAQIELHQRERVEAEVRHLNRELEQRVHERTMALSETNRQLQAEVVERTQAEQRIAASLKEKEVLLQEIHHRVKNNLQVVTSLLNLQSQSIQDSRALAAFQESQHRIRAMALLHERLYRSKDMASIDLGAYVEELVTQLARSYLRQSAAVSLRVDVADVTLNLDTAVPCGLIVNELVSNAFKHAFPSGRQGTISVLAGRVQDNYVRLEVSDDGIGQALDSDRTHAPGLGLQLVDALVAQIDGKMTVRQAGGTHVEIVFPAGQPA